MSNQWYYSEDGAQYGPVDEAEIVRLIQDGELAPGTPVCKEGGMDWQPARNHACFQVEIFPKKKVSKQAATSTTSTPSSGGTSQSPRRTATQPAATPVSPAVTTVVVKEKSVLPWVLFGVVSLVLVAGVVWVFAFMDREGDEPVTQPIATLATNTPTVTNLLGRLLWIFETEQRVTSSPAIGSDGTVYVGSGDKKLYAIKTDSKGLAKSPWPMRGQNARHTGRVMKK